MDNLPIIYLTEERGQIIENREVDMDNIQNLVPEFDFGQTTDLKMIYTSTDVHRDGDLDNQPMHIDQAIAILLKMKHREGATHISIDYQPDHTAYTFQAVKMYMSTAEEIDQEIRNQENLQLVINAVLKKIQ